METAREDRAKAARIVGAVERLGVAGCPSTVRGAALVLTASLVQYVVVSVAWPLRTGRDFLSYARAYDQLFDWHAVLPWIAMQRPPVGPLAVGGALDLAGGWGAEVAAAMLFALAVLAWSAATAQLAPRAGVAVAGALLLSPGYAALFHEWSGDAVFAAAFSLWAFALIRATVARTAFGFACAGLATALLTLTRPSSLPLAAIVVVAAGVMHAPRLSARMVVVVATVAAIALPIGGWAVLNGVRHDDRAIARGGGSTVPLFRAFVDDGIVEPANGPASRELAELVRAELLPEEPYRSYGVTLDEFFSARSPRMHEDLVSLSDRALGWETDYALLAHVGREAVRAHPWVYTRNVAHDLVRTSVQTLFGPAIDRGDRPSISGEALPAPSAGDLPVPTEGQPIPSAHQGAYFGTPDNRIVEVWRSITDHGPVFRRAEDERRFALLERHVAAAGAALPVHGNVPFLARAADRASRVYPPILAWLLAAVVLVIVRRPRFVAAALPAVGAVIVVLLTVVSVAPVGQYVMPLTPAFIALAMVTALGPGRERGPRRETD